MGASYKHLSASVCLLALAACGGGGGGGASLNTNASNGPSASSPSTNSPSTNSSSSTSSSSNTTTPPPAVTILPPTGTGVAGFGASGSNFTTNPPAVGTDIHVAGNSVKVSTTSVADSGIASNGITAVYRGIVPGTSVAQFDFSIPSLSVTANNLRNDGTPVTVSGGQVAATFATMTYTLIGAWAYTQTGGGSYLGQVITGYNTVPSAVPTTGTATYTGNPNTALGGGVIGAYFVPSGTGTITVGALSGNVSLNANFTANTATGSFTNMTATPATGGGAATPWNDVNFSTTFNRTSNPGAVTINGQMTASAPPANAGSAGFAAGSPGTMIGMFYGPAAQEVGGNWYISDPAGGTAGTNGKAAFGTFGAKQ